MKAQIAALEEATQNTNIELSVLSEYRRRVDEHAQRSADLATAVAARDNVKRRCDELRRKRLEGFMAGFSLISLRLKEMYQMITMGGNAELELVDSLDPFSEGILFSVMPPKKSWKNIGNLSGGEKTLSSLALVFALHHYKPTPLYVMDEIDAALDFRNVSFFSFSPVSLFLSGFPVVSSTRCSRLYCRLRSERTVPALRLATCIALTRPLPSITGLHRGELYQGTYQERAVHRDIVAEQHGMSSTPPSPLSSCLR